MQMVAEKPNETLQSIRAMVEQRIVNAVWVLSRLPDPEKRFKKFRSNWPEHNYLYPGEGDPSGLYKHLPAPRRPTPQEIDAYEGTLGWLTTLDKDRYLVFATASIQDGVVMSRKPWKKVADLLKLDVCSRTMNRRYNRALDEIAFKVMIGELT